MGAAALTVFLVRMYLTVVGPGNECQAQRVAQRDFEASGVCTWDTESEDGECTEWGSAVLSTLFFACPENAVFDHGGGE